LSKDVVWGTEMPENRGRLNRETKNNAVCCQVTVEESSPAVLKAE
jgi:hypothetical protein